MGIRPPGLATNLMRQAPENETVDTRPHDCREGNRSDRLRSEQAVMSRRGQ